MADCHFQPDPDTVCAIPGRDSIGKFGWQWVFAQFGVVGDQMGCAHDLGMGQNLGDECLQQVATAQTRLV